ncbi:MAG: hypothetical protein HC892_16680 [Saprospiraceae bacterium]|nr:hypothetical protein [Saprospiraceae bacterium]
MRILAIVLLVFTTLLLCNCERSEVAETSDKGYDFFPLALGGEWIYEVDSIIYDPTNRGVVVDTNQILLRESIVNNYIDGEGQRVFVIERAKRIDESLPWRITDVWTTYQTPSQAVRIEENLAFVKLLFPLQARQDWNANLNIPSDFKISVKGETIDIFKNWTSELLTTDTTALVGSKMYEQVAMVALANSENLIEYRWGQEWYAKGIGLIYKELRVLDTQKIDPNELWEQKAEKGFIVKQRLLSYQ